MLYDEGRCELCLEVKCLENVRKCLRFEWKKSSEEKEGVYEEKKEI